METNQKKSSQWKVWEVFVQSKTGASYTHCGSVHAPDKEMASQYARDLYTRRSEGRSIWVLPAEEIVATQPQEASYLFDPADDKIYRHPQFYKFPKGIHM